MSDACSSACGWCGRCTAAWERTEADDAPESRAERAATMASNAVTDLEVAIWSSKTHDELRTLTVVATDLIKRLETALCSAQTIATHLMPDDDDVKPAITNGDNPFA